MDNNIDKAVDEYSELIKNSDNPQKVIHGFHQSLFKPFTGSKKNDIEFKNSLSADDQKVYDNAIILRKTLWKRFLADSTRFNKAESLVIKKTK